MNKEFSLSIASMIYPSMNSSLDGMSIDIFLYGCNKRCKGCHNPELQQFKKPNHSVKEVIEAIGKVIQFKPTVVTFMGGEPLDTDLKSLQQLITRIKQDYPQLKIALYTGKSSYTEVPLDMLQILDYVKVGEYDESKPSKFGSFLATTNQIMYKKDESGKFFQQYPTE